MNQIETPTFKVERKSMRHSLSTLDFTEDFQAIVEEVEDSSRVFLERPSLALVTGKTVATLRQAYPALSYYGVSTKIHHKMATREGTLGDFLKNVEVGEIDIDTKQSSRRKTKIKLGVVGVTAQIEQERAELSAIFSEAAKADIELPFPDMQMHLATIRGANDEALKAIYDHIINFAPETIDFYDAKARETTHYGEIPLLEQ